MKITIERLDVGYIVCSKYTLGRDTYRAFESLDKAMEFVREMLE